MRCRVGLIDLIGRGHLLPDPWGLARTVLLGRADPAPRGARPPGSDAGAAAARPRRRLGRTRPSGTRATRRGGRSARARGALAAARLLRPGGGEEARLPAPPSLPQTGRLRGPARGPGGLPG